MKQDNAGAMIVLCSYLCVGDRVQPLEPSEWSKVSRLLLDANKLPKDIFTFTDDDFYHILSLTKEQTDRYKRLLDRSASIAFALEDLANIGINVYTRADSAYPRLLKKKLGQSSPPLFYAAGDIEIQKDPFIGMVGSRSIDMADLEFTKKIVAKSVNAGFSVVSGGAKGVDSLASGYALEMGTVAIEYLSDSMLHKLKDKQTIKYIRDGRLLLLSATKPDAGFNVGMAMMRNKYIYAQSEGTVVVRAEKEKGGTWSGAVENLKNRWCHEFCWDNPKYAGNLELIKRGALPIDESFDPNRARAEIEKKEEGQQQSMFELINLSD